MEEWTKFSFQKPRSSISLPTVPAYTSLLPINKTKLDDLKRIIHKYVSTQHHPFYDALTSSVTDDD